MTIGVVLATKKAGESSGLWEMVEVRGPKYNSIFEDLAVFFDRLP
jgi:hypothetical protein